MRKINLCIVFYIISIFFFLSGCRTGQTKAPQVLAEFEYSNNTNEVLVPVEFQGQVYQFGLDTGATHTFFDDRFKDKLGKRLPWPLPRTASVELANGKIVQTDVFPAPKGKIGPFKLESLSYVVVMDSKLTGDDSPGSIGMDFMKKYIVQMDYDRKKVTFFKGKKEFDLFSMFKSKKNKHPEWGEPVPLKTKLFNDSSYFVKGSFMRDIDTNFLIDSGWGLPYDAVDSRIIEKIDACIIRETGDVNSSPYVALQSGDNARIFGKFSLGTLEYENHIFQKHHESVLGQDFLSRHIVTFDFPNKIMYLKNGKKFNKMPNIIIFLGSTGCGINPVNYEVVESDPNSLAYERGIREKDILIEVNNHDISNMNIAEFKEFLSKPPASKSEIKTWTFKRGDDTFTVTFIKKSGKKQ